MTFEKNANESFSKVETITLQTCQFVGAFTANVEIICYSEVNIVALMGTPYSNTPCAVCEVKQNRQRIDVAL